MAENHEIENPNLPVTRSRTLTCAPGEWPNHQSLATTTTYTETTTRTNFTETFTDVTILEGRETGGLHGGVGTKSKGSKWSIDEYRLLWECFILCCYRPNDQHVHWRELLHQEWTRREGRQVKSKTLEDRLRDAEVLGVLSKREKELIEARVKQLLTAEGVMVAIKDDEEDDEEYANRTLHNETIDEFTWRESILMEAIKIEEWNPEVDLNALPILYNDLDGIENDT